MAELQCLICEWTVPKSDNPENELLGLLGVGSTDAGLELLKHMQDHDLGDWIKAFKMADAYIAQLEANVERLTREVSQAKAAAVEFQTNPVMRRGEPQRSAFQPPTGAFEDDGLLAANGQPLSRYLTPAEIARKREQARVRAEIEAADPDESLIPYIAPSARPEGVVGRKM